MNHVVYILYSERLNRYYCGSSEDIERRIKEHNAGKGNYTKKGVPWILVKKIELASRSEAMKLEGEIKKRGIKRFLDHLSNSSGGGAAR